MKSINPFENKEQEIIIDDEIIKEYRLDEWAKEFSLMTAGYRDRLDPDDISNPDVSFNLITLAILGEAKARVFNHGGNSDVHVHIGGETRPHTQEFISLLSRVYAAHGCIVHLRKGLKTTPIWYSSFGIFFEGYNSGDSITASHAEFFRGGWKPLDKWGKQVVNEEQSIIEEVKRIVKERSMIKLAPCNSENIVEDLDIDEKYVKYQKSVISESHISEINKAAERGFKCSICPVGGSMKKTTERLFKHFNIKTGDGEIINYYFGEEDSRYHGIGLLKGVNYGVDPSKPEIYKNVGAQDKIQSGAADIVFMWDPDGDRFNMITKAPKDKGENFKELGLNVDYVENSDHCFVYFTPNQIYFMLAAFQIESLKKSENFDKYSWFIATTGPSTHMLEELSKVVNISIIHQQVGFKHWGSFVEWFDENKEKNVPFVTSIGEKVYFNKNSRLIIMCEESGGAVLGGTELLENKSATKRILGLCEKDGFQIGLVSLSLASKLYNEKSSFAEHYTKLLKEYNIKNIYYRRHDRRLYDESLLGEEREKDKEKGLAIRDEVMKFFRDLAINHKEGERLDQIQASLNKRLKEGCIKLPKLEKLSLIGDGTLLEGIYFVFSKFWFVIRASGTDALLRYYVEGRSKEEVENYIDSLVNLRI